jgi:hypothetical protein
MKSNRDNQITNFINIAGEYVRTVKIEIDKTNPRDISKIHMLHSKILGVYDFVKYALGEKKI